MAASGERQIKQNVPLTSWSAMLSETGNLFGVHVRDAQNKKPKHTTRTIQGRLKSRGYASCVTENDTEKSMPHGERQQMPSDAFSATYSDWKLIRTRKVVQIVLEVPIEAADHAYKVLGGMPNPASEIWVGVARFKSENPRSLHDASQHDRPSLPEVKLEGGQKRAAEQSVAAAKLPDGHGSQARAGANRKSWHDMPPAQQAGILCADKSFITFLASEYQRGCDNETEAADIVRWYCDVFSRTELKRGSQASVKWQELVFKYRTWQLAAQVVPV